MTSIDELREAAGLCGTCAHVLIRPTRRGTTYLRCGLAAEGGYPKYPQLPTHDCTGYEVSRAPSE